jgi:hypothetical protein
LASWTISRMSHCRPLIEKRPPFSAMDSSRDVVLAAPYGIVSAIGV